MKLLRVALLTVFIALGWSGLSRAQDEPPQGEGGSDIESWDLEGLLNDTVVTGTGQVQARALVPATVTRWDREEIQRHGWSTIAEVLAYTPGLYVIDDNVTPSVGVRGVSGGLRAGTRIVRVMINGTEVSFRPDLTAFLGPEFIPIEAVESVEVAKGPLSALYGANAFLATVNIITRKPVAGLSGEVSGRVYDNHGKFGYGGSGITSYSTEKLDLLLGVGAAHSDRSGLQLSKTFPQQNASLAQYSGFFGNPSRDDTAKPQSFYGSGRLAIGNHGTLTLQGGRQVISSQGEFQPGSVLTHDSRIGLANNWIASAYKHNINTSVSLTAKLGLSSGSPTGAEQLSASDQSNFYYKRNFGYQALNGQLSGSALLPHLLELTAGVDYTLDREDILYFSQIYRVPVFNRPVGYVRDRIGDDVARHQTIANFGGYAQLGGHPITALPDLYVFANARVDWLNLFDTQFSWRAGTAYQWNDHIATKLFVGRAFQTPSAVQLFARPGFGSAGSIVGSNALPFSPPLEPQSIISVELANTFAFSKAFVLEQSFWYEDVRNSIALTQIVGDFTPRNLANQHIGGAELSVRSSVDRYSAFGTLSGQAIQSDNRQDEKSFGFHPPAEFPTYMATAGAAVSIPEVYAIADVTSQLVGARGSSQSNTIVNNRETYQLPAYAVLNATVQSSGVHIFGKDYETQLAVSAFNILNNHYAQPGNGGFDIPNLGRRFLFRLTQRF